MSYSIFDALSTCDEVADPLDRIFFDHVVLVNVLSVTPDVSFEQVYALNIEEEPDGFGQRLVEDKKRRSGEDNEGGSTLESLPTVVQIIGKVWL